jgi:hypothetical protein
MPELIPGPIAARSADVEAPPPRPFRIRDSGRRDPDPSQWARPLPPVLWRRLDDEQRQTHERAVEAHAEAAARARELTVKARQQASDDEQALRDAVGKGARPPKPKAVAAEQAAAEAVRAAEMAARLAIESGRELAAGFSDEDVRDAMHAAQEQARGIIEVLPEVVDRLLAELTEAAQLGGEARWLGQLVERRIAGPWQPSSAPLTHRLASAAEAARTLQAHLCDELEEHELRSRSVEHHAPVGALPEGAWVAAGIDPTR